MVVERRGGGSENGSGGGRRAHWRWGVGLGLGVGGGDLGGGSLVWVRRGDSGNDSGAGFDLRIGIGGLGGGRLGGRLDCRGFASCSGDGYEAGFQTLRLNAGGSEDARRG